VLILGQGVVGHYHCCGRHCCCVCDRTVLYVKLRTKIWYRTGKFDMSYSMYHNQQGLLQGLCSNKSKWEKLQR
jgi:hypothetical protein